MHKGPDGANVRVLINVEKILNSEFARSHDAEKHLADAFEERSMLIPPRATRFVLAGQFDLERQTRVWEAAAIEIKTPVKLDQVAKQAERQVEKIEGAAAVGTQRDFLVDLGDNQVGVLAPSNRQQTARWLRQLKKNEPSLSDYLAKAASYGDTAGTDIILAIDLTDVLPQKFIADKLRESEVLKGRTAEIGKIASILAGARGARVAIKIGTKCSGKLIVDFQSNPAPLAEFSKPLILSALAEAGVMLEDMEEWKLTVGKQSVALEGSLSDDGLRRVMSVVEVPQESLAAVDPDINARPSRASNTSQSLTIEASRRYFKNIQTQLDSLRLEKEKKTLGQTTQWIESAARRIDSMSTLNVDSDLADYGGAVAVELRQIVAYLRNIDIQSARRASNVVRDDSYYYGYGQSSQAAKRQVRAEERAGGVSTTSEIARHIADQSAAMRRKMTDRYKTDF